MRAMLLLVPLALTACGPITFDTRVSGQGTVAGSPLGALLDRFPTIGGLANLDFSQNQDFQTNKVTRDKVRTVKVTSLVARITAPASADFGFVDSLELTAKADGQPDLVFAKKDNIPQSATRPPDASVTFDVLDVDLAPYVRAPSTTLALTGRGRQPAQDTTLEVTVALRVGAVVF